MSPLSRPVPRPHGTPTHLRPLTVAAGSLTLCLVCAPGGARAGVALDRAAIEEATSGSEAAPRRLTTWPRAGYAHGRLQESLEHPSTSSDGLRLQAVRARHRARLLAQAGRQQRNPAALQEAALLLEAYPAAPPRAYAEAGDDWTPPSVRYAPQAIDLRAEARAFGGPPPQPAESTGPPLPLWQRCGHLPPQGRLAFPAQFPAGPAAAALSGDARLRLSTRLADGTEVQVARGGALLEWRGDAGERTLVIENDSPQRLDFCLESSAAP